MTAYYFSDFAKNTNRERNQDINSQTACYHRQTHPQLCEVKPAILVENSSFRQQLIYESRASSEDH